MFRINEIRRVADGHLNRRFYRAVELMMKIRREEEKSRQPRPGRHPDNDFDVYRFPEDESDPTVEHVSGPTQAEHPASAQPQAPSNQSSRVVRSAEKQRNKPKSTTREPRQHRETIRDLRRRLTQLTGLGGDLQP